MVGITLNFLDSIAPKTIFCNNITKDLANKIGIRSQLTMTLGVVEDNKESIAIIPFPEEEIVAFVYLFSLPKFPKEKYVISYAVDNSKQLVLYRRIPILQQSTKNLISEIERHKTPLHKIEESLLKGYRGIFEPIPEITSIKDHGYSVTDQKEQKTSLSEDEQLRITIKMLGKNPEVAFRAVITEEPLIILVENAADKLLVEKLPWHTLIPQRQLKIHFWSDSPCDLIDHDLLFADRSLKKICHGFVIADLETGKNEGGKKDVYLANFFNYLVSDKCPNPMSELRKLVNNLLYWSQEIIDLCSQEVNKNVEGRIANIIEMHRRTPMGDRLNIVGEIASIYNPIIRNRIASYFLQKELGISKNIDLAKIKSQL
ncbi:MAG: hypothetical protein ACW967_09085 [Candidatus Hodarchaeales archaeon]|jgi:hypothetical protein